MEKSRPIRNWNALEIYWDCKKLLSEKIAHPCWFIAMPATTLDEVVFDKVPRPGIEPGPPGWEPGILTTRQSGRWWNWKEGNLMNTCFRMKWEAMWWSFAEFQSHQPNPSSCVCSTHEMLMCAIRSQSHLIRNIAQALKFQPFKSSHLCSLATQKRNRMRSSGWNPLH